MTALDGASDALTPPEGLAAGRGPRGWLRSAGLRFLLRRLLLLVVTLVLSSILIYASVRLVPGNPVTFLTQGRVTNPQQIAALKKQFQIDQPLVSGYITWVGRALRGDFGLSLRYREPVLTVISPRVETTVLLVGMASLFIIIFGTALGVISALSHRAVDSAILVGTTVAAATPGFVAAVFLALIFGSKLGWFPIFGDGTGFADRLYHYVLPSIALALSSIGLMARVTRAAIREESQQDHVQTAIVRGLRRGHIVRRHVIRNSLIPMTTVAGLMVVYLIVGSVVIEDAFQLNGLGSLLVQSVLDNDFAVVQVIILLLVVAIVVLNAVVDVLYTFVDPRIRL